MGFALLHRKFNVIEQSVSMVVVPMDDGNQTSGHSCSQHGMMIPTHAAYWVPSGISEIWNGYAPQTPI